MNIVVQSVDAIVFDCLFFFVMGFIPPPPKKKQQKEKHITNLSLFFRLSVQSIFDLKRNCRRQTVIDDPPFIIIIFK